MTRMIPLDSLDYEILRDLAEAAKTTDSITDDESAALDRLIAAYESGDKA